MGWALSQITMTLPGITVEQGTRPHSPAIGSPGHCTGGAPGWIRTSYIAARYCADTCFAQGEWLIISVTSSGVNWEADLVFQKGVAADSRGPPASAKAPQKRLFLIARRRDNPIVVSLIWGY